MTNGTVREGQVDLFEIPPVDGEILRRVKMENGTWTAFGSRHGQDLPRSVAVFEIVVQL